ncbi:hypothetical protein DACRYDRAFT_106518 [Dacryopinax primogenitus]|uniref:DUF6533 domain-containing protein n=1 Tax=Dacryopinax primogenitus (strain DJM 731) TaxID=1858805 RepID=M5G3V6_DACPD|nr:uncharacterized protein DACRYDRAFT_106518 [Dacryopinax primogenitus]EJU03359.1 hypothetical protein DACRYDRAFT_106518 [Dacryopinax primogenitus]
MRLTTRPSPTRSDAEADLSISSLIDPQPSYQLFSWFIPLLGKLCRYHLAASVQQRGTAEVVLLPNMSTSSVSGANYTLPPGYTGTLDDYVQSIFNAGYFDMVATAIVIFDTVIILGDEIHLVWQGRWGLPTIVYFLNHYGILFQALLNQVAVNDVYLSPEHCLQWNLASNWFIPIIMMFAEAMLVFRITALHENNVKVSIAIRTLYFACSGIMSLLTGLLLDGVGPFASADGSVLACDIRQLGENMFYTIWIPSLVLETVLVLMTLAKSLAHRRNGLRTPLLAVLVRDGFMYFFIVFGVMLTNLVICMTVEDVYYALVSHRLTLCVSSILSSRLFLHLRKTAYQSPEGYSTQNTDKPPSLVESAISEPLSNWLDFHERNGEEGDREGLERSESNLNGKTE